MGDSQPRRLEERLAFELGTILLMVAAALLQVTLLQLPLGFPVPLILILIVSRTLVALSSLDPDEGVLIALRWAIYAGLTLDLLANVRFGSHVLALLVVVIVVALTMRRFSAERIIIPLVAVMGSTLIYESLLALLIAPQPLDWAIYARIVLIPTMLIALIPTLPIFLGLRWALRRQL